MYSILQSESYYFITMLWYYYIGNPIWGFVSSKVKFSDICTNTWQIK